LTAKKNEKKTTTNRYKAVIVLKVDAIEEENRDRNSNRKKPNAPAPASH
jgi:hypothetical protein